MKVTSVVDVKAHLSAYMEECRRAPIVITKNGRPKAMLLSVPDDEDELERFLLAHNPRFTQILEEGERNIRETGGIPHDKFWAQVNRETAKRRRVMRSKDRK